MNGQREPCETVASVVAADGLSLPGEGLDALGGGFSSTICRE
jgi:hypothetical protein